MPEFTKLDLKTKVNALLDRDGDAVVKGLKAEKASGKTDPGTAKLVGTLYNAIRNDIIAQGTVFKSETEAAIQKCGELHALTKQNAKQCQELIEQLAKKWDKDKGDDVEGKASECEMAVDYMNTMKKEMKNHEGFRGGFCDKNNAMPILGQRRFDELNTKYLEYREQPLKNFMSLGDKWDKIEEHTKRAMHFVGMLPALKKVAGQSDSIRAALQEDAQAVAQLNKVFAESAKGKKAQLTSTISYINGVLAKKEKVSQAYLKTAKTTLESSKMEMKGHYSKLKTAEQIRDRFLAKAGPVAKEAQVTSLLANIKQECAAMKVLIEAWDAEHAKALTAHAAASK